MKEESYECLIPKYLEFAHELPKSKREYDRIILLWFLRGKILYVFWMLYIWDSFLILFEPYNAF